MGIFSCFIYSHSFQEKKNQRSGWFYRRLFEFALGGFCFTPTFFDFLIFVVI